MTQLTLTNVPTFDQDASKSQWFTPPPLAQRIVRWAFERAGIERTEDITILEPSAGNGSIVREILDYAPAALVIANDVDRRCVDALERLQSNPRYRGRLFVQESDFLQLGTEPKTPIDLVIQNSPFEGGATEAHIARAHQIASIVVSHVPLTTLAGQKRKTGLWAEHAIGHMVIHSSRPAYEGASDGGGATDMATLLTVKRDSRTLCPKALLALEWW